MREILLLIATSGLSVAAAAKPQFGLLAYIWFSLMRPDYIAFSLGRYNYSFMLATGMMLGGLREFAQFKRAWLTNPISWLVVLLQIPILISTQTAILPSYSLDIYTTLFKMFVAVLWIPVLTYKVEQMRLLFLVTAVSLGAHAVWQSLGGIITGGRAIRFGIGGFMSDNNTFAAGLVMVFPFCWYSRYLVRQYWMKALLAVMCAACLFTIMLTHSRGAAVAAVVVLLMLLIHSKRRLLVLVFLLVAGVPGLYMVRDTYFDRLGTIQNYEEDNSAMSRIVHNKLALQIWAEHPVTGIGIGLENYFVASTPYLRDIGENNRVGLVVHNSYLQMLVHCGLPAALIHLCLFVGATLMMWRSSRRLAVTHPGLEYYPRAIELSIVGYLIASLTQPRATFDFAYAVVMYAAAWYAIEKQLPPQTPTPVPVQYTAPPPPVAVPVEESFAGTTRMLGRHEQRRR